jgi:hypothetical protein
MEKTRLGETITTFNGEVANPTKLTMFLGGKV